MGLTLLLIGAGLLAGRLGAGPAVGSPLLGRTVADRDLPALESGTPLRISTLRGSVVVVNFWASWCVPCQRENPTLVALSKTYPDVAFVGVGFQDAPDAARAFLDRYARGGPNYRYVTDPDSRAALDFGVFGIPETFVLDRQGAVRSKLIGEIDYPTLAGAMDAVLAGREPTGRRPGSVQPGPGQGQVGG